MRSPLLISILILAAPGIAHAGTRQEAKVLLSEDPSERKFQEDWGYADAIVAGDTVYLSGVARGLLGTDRVLGEGGGRAAGEQQGGQGTGALGNHGSTPVGMPGTRLGARLWSR